MLAVRATVRERSCQSRAPSFAALPSTPEKGLAAGICLLSVSIFPGPPCLLIGCKQTCSLLISVVLRKSQPKGHAQKAPTPCLERLPKPADGCQQALDGPGDQPCGRWARPYSSAHCGWEPAREPGSRQKGCLSCKLCVTWSTGGRSCHGDGRVGTEGVHEPVIIGPPCAGGSCCPGQAVLLLFRKLDSPVLGPGAARGRHGDPAFQEKWFRNIRTSSPLSLSF